MWSKKTSYVLNGKMLLLLAFACGLWSFAIPCIAQEHWWQREVPAPGTHYSINPDYLNKRRELEQAWDHYQHNIQAASHFQRLGQNTRSLNAAISNSRNRMNRLEYELSEIPMYVSTSQAFTKESKAPRASPNLEESWRKGWAPEPFKESPRWDVLYTPMEGTHTQASQSVSCKSVSSNDTKPKEIRLEKLLQLIRQTGFSVDAISDSLFRITDPDGFGLLIRAGFPGEFRFLKTIVLAEGRDMDVVLRQVNDLNETYPTLRSHVTYRSSISQPLLHIESRIAATTSDFTSVLANEIDALRKAYCKIIKFNIEDNTLR